MSLACRCVILVVVAVAGCHCSYRRRCCCLCCCTTVAVVVSVFIAVVIVVFVIVVVVVVVLVVVLVAVVAVVVIDVAVVVVVAVSIILACYYRCRCYVVVNTNNTSDNYIRDVTFVLNFLQLIFFKGCFKSIGLEDRSIPDSSMTSSTALSDYSKAPRGRLNLPSGSTSLGSWKPNDKDQDQWLQVDFGAELNIIQIATQGTYQTDEYVTRYSLEYGQDGLNFTPYASGKVTLGNLVV